MQEQYNISDALHVWYCLEMAKEGVGTYGGNSADIYVQHLLPPDYDTSIGKALWIQASKNLKQIVTAFCNMHGVDASINGKPVGDWMDEYQLVHKCEVHITPKKVQQDEQEAVA